MDKPYEVTVDLVSSITGIPWKGIDLAPYLCKDGEKLDKNEMDTKYHLSHSGKGFLLSSIDDSVVRAATKVLCRNVLHKMRPTECTITIV